MLSFFLLGIQIMKFILEMNTTLGKEKNYIEVFQNSNKTINTYTLKTLDKKMQGYRKQFRIILETAPQKKADMQPLPFHFLNYSRKKRKRKKC